MNPGTGTQICDPTPGVSRLERHIEEEPARGPSAHAQKRFRSGIGPRLLVGVMIPVVALGVLGAVGVTERYRDANAVSGVVAQVGRVERTLRLYAGLVSEASATETVVVAMGYGLSVAQASKLAHYDVVAHMRSARSDVDAALAHGGAAVLGVRVARLAPLRARVDAGTEREAASRAFFLDSTQVAERSWRTQVGRLTNQSFRTAGSPGIRRAVAGLSDAVDAFIAGTNATNAAASLTVPGVPGGSTGAMKLAAASALYARASSGLRTELGGTAGVAWQRLIVSDSAVNTFRRFLAALLEDPSHVSAGQGVAEMGRTFNGGLIFLDHLRKVVTAAAADIAPLARDLRTNARQGLERYLLVLGLIAAFSLALTLIMVRGIVTPLRWLAKRASEVSDGAIDGDPLDLSGPYEVAAVTETFNEIVANLAVLDATTQALASADLDSAALTTSVPGRIGDSLRHSVATLQQSIRDNEELRESLTLSETRFRDLAEKSPDVIFRFSRDPAPHFDYLSPSFEHLTGISVEKAESDFRVFVGALDDEGRALVADAAAGRNFRARADLGFRRPDGTVAVFELRLIRTADGLQGVGRDVTELRVLQAQLAEQATRDPLTGLANRRLLDEFLERAIRGAGRSGIPITVAFLDLDDFKSVNDTYGHEAGDTVLRFTADRLRAALRDEDVIARYGGDEFVIVCEGADESSSGDLAERIQAALDVPIDIEEGVSVLCRPSVGVADTRTTAFDAAALIDAADHAMLDVKNVRNGRRFARPNAAR